MYTDEKDHYKPKEILSKEQIRIIPEKRGMNFTIVICMLLEYIN